LDEAVFYGNQSQASRTSYGVVARCASCSVLYRFHRYQHRAWNLKSVLSKNEANRKLTRGLWLFAAGSFGFGFALVPLYDVLCDVTGYGDRSRLLEASAAIETPDDQRSVTIELVSNTSAFGDWEFRPVNGDLKVHPGRLYEAKFYAKNLRTQPVTGQAIPSIAPMQATQYFQKTECFCFTPQRFDASQTRELTVRFIVDPKLPVTIDRVTLAYSMYTTDQKPLAVGS
jgi:cytochrome c oxidase assembly protein subunit 11